MVSIKVAINIKSIYIYIYIYIFVIYGHIYLAEATERESELHMSVLRVHYVAAIIECYFINAVVFTYLD